MQEERTTFIECECSSIEHIARFTYFSDETDERHMLYLEIMLNEHLGFWHRLKIGLQYILGHKSKFGPFQEILFDTETAKRIVELLNRYIDNAKRNQENESP